MLREKELKALRDLAKGAAQAAGEYIQSQFDQHYDQGHKKSGDSKASQVVTAVDIKAQEIILQYLEDSILQYDLGLLTEELADNQSRLEKDYFWCIDPMDGTLAFTESRTGYAVSIALVSQSGNPLIGVVYVPDLKEIYCSMKGSGVRLNDEPFTATGKTVDDGLHLYLDKSLLSESYYQLLTEHLNNWAKENKNSIKYYFGYGAVRNALGVMNSNNACYFKFPKKQKGGGSIWDYAATRLFFEELGLIVSTSFGEKLHLNNPDTCFMNRIGLIYSTDKTLTEHLKTFYYNIIH